VILVAVYSDDVARLLGVNVSERNVVRYLPLIMLTLLGGFFGPVYYWAPWRFVWRLFPAFNRWFFPDLNGVWVGSTSSNWPTIAKMLEAAQAHRGIEQAELHAVPEQRDAMAVQIRASLFLLKISAGLSSTDGQSHSVTARARHDQHSDDIHLTYVYEQSTPDPAITDEDKHMGAADLVVDLDDPSIGEGVYWTRRRWKLGLNTAGKLELRRITSRKDPSKNLRQYAAEEKARAPSGFAESLTGFTAARRSAILCLQQR
jgi:hypothetical protein